MAPAARPRDGWWRVLPACRTATPHHCLLLPPSSCPTSARLPAAAKSLPGSAKASGVRLAKPACVPAPPFFLTAFLVHLSASVPLPVLKATVESALKAADVDYEYNDAKWKAKCFLYRTCGNCSFVLRLYTTGGGAGPDAAPGMTTPTGAQQATSPAALLQPLTAASLSGRAPATTTSSFPSLPSLGSSAPAPALPAVAPAAAAAAATNSSGAETFLIELQRRKGCGHLFRRTYDRLVTHFAAAKLLPADCPAAARARALGLLPAGVERPLGAPAASAADVVPVVPAARDFAGGAGVDCPPPHTVLADRRADGTGYGDDDADEDDDDGVSGGEEAPTTLASGTTTGTGSARDPRGVLDAFASLAALLGSDYDDISAPAAQSIASLSTSRKMRRVVGEAAAAGAAAAAAAAATGASSRARSSGSDSAATTPAASPSHAASAPSTTPAAAGAAAAATTAVAAATAADAQSAAAAALLQTLLNRAVFQRASTECRTSAALSLASFARDARCAEALATLNAGAVLLTAAALVPLSAPTAALRRELVRAVLNMTLAAPATARAAVREPAVIHLRTYALMRPPFAGVDHAFDAVVRRLEEVLTPVAREVGAPMQITVQAAAGATVATVQQQQQQLQLQQQAASPATTPVAAAAAAAARGGRAM